MKKVISFLLSLVIFCGMVVSVDWGLKNGFRSKDMPALNYELNKVKFRNYELINSIGIIFTKRYKISSPSADAGTTDADDACGSWLLSIA